MDKCIICGNEDIKKVKAEIVPFVKERMYENKDLVSNAVYCPECHFVCSEVRPTDEQMSRYYQNYMKDEYVESRDKFEPGFMNWRKEYDEQGGFEKELTVRKSVMHKILSKYLDFKEVKTVLDWGGARGEFILDDFINAEKFVYDIDSTSPIEGVKKLSENELGNYKWDFIMCCHTLEHVSYPMDLINKIIDKMEIGSILYIEVPHEPYAMETALCDSVCGVHEHINFFKKETFEKIFDKRNFVILEASTIKQDALFGQSEIVYALVQKTDSITKMIDKNQNVMKKYMLQSEDKLVKLESDLIKIDSKLNEQQSTLEQQLVSILNEQMRNQEQLMELINIQTAKLNDLTQFVNYKLNRLTFLQQVFSIRNEGKHKVVRILGIKFKFRRKVKCSV